MYEIYATLTAAFLSCVYKDVKVKTCKDRQTDRQTILSLMDKIPTYLNSSTWGSQ